MTTSSKIIALDEVISVASTIISLLDNVHHRIPHELSTRIDELRVTLQKAKRTVVEQECRFNLEDEEFPKMKFVSTTEMDLSFISRDFYDVDEGLRRWSRICTDAACGGVCKVKIAHIAERVRQVREIAEQEKARVEQSGTNRVAGKNTDAQTWEGRLA